MGRTGAGVGWYFRWSPAARDCAGYREAVVPRMTRGGLLIADNVVSHEAVLRSVIDHVLSDHRVDALIVPIGKGELVCRKM